MSSHKSYPMLSYLWFGVTRTDVRRIRGGTAVVWGCGMLTGAKVSRSGSIVIKLVSGDTDLGTV